MSDDDPRISELERRNAELTAELVRLRSGQALAAAVDVMLEGFQIVDRDWRYRYVNATAAAHGHRSPAALVGRTMMECYPGIEATELFRSLERCLATGKREWLQNHFAYPDGGDGWFELVVNPIPEGLLILSVDVTERKRLELKNNELEAFSWSVAHDLRAPLRAVEGFAAFILDDYAPALGETGVAYVEHIRGATQRMGALIEDLLALARVNRVELVRQKVDLSDAAASTCERLRSSEPVRHVDVVIEPGLVADADPGLLAILLDNLLGNAWKFTARRDPARIEVGRRDDAYFVSDNGAGFDMAHEGKLFGLFQRLHAPDEFAGTGIGLSIVQRIARRHGGRVWADARPEEGATFYFTLSDW